MKYCELHHPVRRMRNFAELVKSVKAHMAALRQGKLLESTDKVELRKVENSDLWLLFY